MAQIITTKDGSHTIFSEEFNDHYHSTFGAIHESEFIYIQNGLNFIEKEIIKVFEVGFGTGLNAILAYKESLLKKIKIEYHTIELHPIDNNTIKNLNYNNYLSEDQKNVFNKMHVCSWNKEISISKDFSFKKVKADFNTYTFDQKYDVVFFDAFAPEKQALMWSVTNFTNIYNNLINNGILITYSSKGTVKKSLRDANFKVSRLTGPIGKRHILRAQKQME